MDGASRTSSPVAVWDPVARDLGGSFRAVARGLLGSRFSLLLGEGEAEWGQLRMLGAYAAEVRAGGTVSEIQRTGEFGARYRVRTGGAPLLIAGPERPKEGLRIFCGGKVYEAETNVLRNVSVARRLAEAPGEAEGTQEIRLSGGIAGRGYRGTFPGEDGGALAVAVFLLYRNVALRRTAF